jgi:hypothetical protein
MLVGAGCVKPDGRPRTKSSTFEVFDPSRRTHPGIATGISFAPTSVRTDCTDERQQSRTDKYRVRTDERQMNRTNKYRDRTYCFT